MGSIMRNLKLKRNIFLSISIFVFCSVLFCSLFVVSKKNKDENVTNAATEYIESSSIISELIKPSKVYDKSYSLNMYYPIMTENQTTSFFVGYIHH